MQAEATKVALSIPESHACYAGHFPGDPLVPGALMVQWLVELIEAEDKKKGKSDLTITVLKSMKFILPIRPGDDCEVTITHRDEKIMIECTCKGQLVLKGQFLVESK